MTAEEIQALEIPKTGGVNEDREITFILKILRELTAQVADLNENLRIGMHGIERSIDDINS